MTTSILPQRLRRLAASLGCLGLSLVGASAAQAQWLNPPQRVPVKQAQVAPGLVFCSGYESTPGCAAVLGGDGQPLVYLEQLAPAAGEGTSTQFRAGWPLIFRA